MKQVLLLAIVLLVSLPLYAQSLTDSVSIVTLLKNDYLTLGNADVKGHVENCSRDYVLIENGELWNLEREVAYMKTERGGKSALVADTLFFYIRFSCFLPTAVVARRNDHLNR